MFRYRQTQQLQKDLEKRFGRLFKPLRVEATTEKTPDSTQAGARQERREAVK